MLISLIAAIGENNELGKDNGLLWHLPDDLKFFKKHTSGHCVIMGRKTFESIGKALPKRANIIVSQFQNFSGEGINRAVSLPDAVEMARESGEQGCFIIGGGMLYIPSMDIADRLYITRVHAAFEADVFFPEIDFSEWKKTFSEAHLKDEEHAYDFTFEIYERA